MLILTMKTDSPVAEIGLYDDESCLTSEVWQAHRELSATIHTKMQALLKEQQKSWSNIAGIVCFAGPGSFTGLRIGLAVGNALAYGIGTSIVATKGSGWVKQGISRLKNGDNDPMALPFYGGEAHVTVAKI